MWMFLKRIKSNLSYFRLFYYTIITSFARSPKSRYNANSHSGVTP